MGDIDTIERAVEIVAEDLGEAFDLPAWEVVRVGSDSPNGFTGPMLRSPVYVGRDGSTPADFTREVAQAFESAGLVTVDEPGVGDGGWLIGTARVAGRILTVRSKGQIEIIVG